MTASKLEEQTRKHDMDDDDKKIVVKREEALERERIDKPKPRIGAKDEKQASRTGDAGEREGWRRSQRTTKASRVARSETRNRGLTAMQEKHSAACA